MRKNKFKRYNNSSKQKRYKIKFKNWHRKISKETNKYKNSKLNC